MNPYCVQMPSASQLNIAMPMSDKKKAEMAAKRAQKEAAKTQVDFNKRYNVGGDGEYIDYDWATRAEWKTAVAPRLDVKIVSVRKRVIQNLHVLCFYVQIKNTEHNQEIFRNYPKYLQFLTINTTMRIELKKFSQIMLIPDENGIKQRYAGELEF